MGKFCEELRESLKKQGFFGVFFAFKSRRLNQKRRFFRVLPPKSLRFFYSKIKKNWVFGEETGKFTKNLAFYLL